MEYEEIIYTKEVHIATIKLNRPEQRNAFSPTMIASLLRAIEDAAQDEEIRVLILTGEGPSFCTGGDVKAMAAASGGRDATGEGVPLYRAIHHFPKPTIAAVNGTAMGGGLEIALACDIRIASDKARFSEAFIKRGMMPTGSSTYILPRLVGLDRALLLIWTGDMIDAKEAERIGLVTKVVAHDELNDTVIELADKLAKAAPLAVKAAKTAIYQALDTSLDEAIEWAAERKTELTNTEDHKEGARAFVEKREPFFKGK